MKSVGYDIYDVYDLGEFDQKAGVRTKYGTKEELLELAKTAKEHDVVIYVDAVLNHMFGADETERFRAKEVDPNDRTRAISDFYDIEVGMFYPIPNDYLTAATGLDQVYIQGEEQPGTAFGKFQRQVTESYWSHPMSPVQRFQVEL